MTDWVRLWHDMPTDPKWRVIARKSGQQIAVVISVFNFVLVNASANAAERGRTHNLNSEDIAAALDIDEADVDAVRAAMEGKVLDGDRLMGWEKRQPKREDSSAERAKEWRERNKTQPNAAERPETKTETKTDKKKLSSDEEPPLAQSDLIGDAVLAWNALAHDCGLRTVERMNDSRKRSIKVRLKECGGIEGWNAALAKIRGSPFLRGENDRVWKADFDFILQPTSFLKLMEGKYDAKPRQAKPGKPTFDDDLRAIAEVFNQSPGGMEAGLRDAEGPVIDNADGGDFVGRAASYASH